MSSNNKNKKKNNNVKSNKKNNSRKPKHIIHNKKKKQQLYAELNKQKEIREKKVEGKKILKINNISNQVNNNVEIKNHIKENINNCNNELEDKITKKDILNEKTNKETSRVKSLNNDKIIDLIILFLSIILIISLCYSVFKITSWYVDSIKVKEEIKKIEEKVLIEEVEDTGEVEIIESEEIHEFDPYWDYIKMNLMDVDFNELKLENNEVAGWIQLPGTNINYPFVQAKDNDYYLKHSFNKKYNGSGWVFMDYRNNKDDYDKNTILYGHSMLNGSVFGTLKNVFSSNWLNNKDIHIIKISTETENSLWQIFSIYHIENTSDYLKVNFNNDEEYLEFLNMLKNRSTHDFGTTVDVNDKIISLSTCYINSDNKSVIHAKLIKRSVK